VRSPRQWILFVRGQTFARFLRAAGRQKDGKDRPVNRRDAGTPSSRPGRKSQTAVLLFIGATRRGERRPMLARIKILQIMGYLSATPPLALPLDVLGVMREQASSLFPACYPPNATSRQPR